MSAPAPPTTPPHTRPTSGFRLLLRELLSGSRWLLVPAVGAVIVVPIIAVLVYHFAGELDRGVWEFVGQPLRWILFASGIVMALAVPVVVAHGITRRTITRALSVVVGILAIAAGLYMAAGYLAEWAVYTAVDLPLVLGDGHLFTATTQVHLVVAEYTLASAGYLISGWLTAMCYYRLGGFWGTLCLPLTLLPLVGVEAALITSTWVLNVVWVIFTGDMYDPVPQPFPAPLRIGLALLVIAAGLAAAWRVGRRLPLRSPHG